MRREEFQEHACWPQILGPQGRAALAHARRRGYLVTRDPQARPGEHWRLHCRRRRLPWVVVILSPTSAKIRIDLEPAGRHFRPDAMECLADLLRQRLGSRCGDCWGGGRLWWVKRVPAEGAEELARDLRRLALQVSDREQIGTFLHAYGQHDYDPP